MKLRPYQQKAVDVIFKSWCEFQKTLLVLPTGTGKTVCFSKVAEQALNEGDDKILILAHREELLKQAQDKIKTATGLDCCFEKAGEKVKKRFLICSCESFFRLEFSNWHLERRRAFFSLFFTDAHQWT